MPTFAELGLEQYLIRALESLSITLPSEVQSACIPPILAGRDCIASAQTGSGKTLAFALPMLQHLSQDPYGIFAVVLTPTRELAFQIHDQFKAVGISGGLSLQSTVAVGGLDMMAQATELRKRPHVVVATPGRLADLLTNSSAGEWDLSRVKYLVLDEADRLLAPSFAKELGTLISSMPTTRQTLLFTATMTDAILALRDKPPAAGKEKPFVHLSEEMISTPATLTQRYLFIPSTVRDLYLFYLLTHVPTLLSIRSAFKRKSDTDYPEREPLCQAIVFISRCKSAQHLSHTLTELDIANAPLHSHLTQRERLASLSAFRASSVPLLIATDVGARGLDIPEVDLVINWDLPREPDDYVHRVGRTARAGKSGTAVSIVCEGDVDLLKAIEDRVGEYCNLLPLVAPLSCADPKTSQQALPWKSSNAQKSPSSNRSTRSARRSAWPVFNADKKLWVIDKRSTRRSKPSGTKSPGREARWPRGLQARARRRSLDQDTAKTSFRQRWSLSNIGGPMLTSKWLPSSGTSQMAQAGYLARAKLHLHALTEDSHGSRSLKSGNLGPRQAAGARSAAIVDAYTILLLPKGP